MNAIDFIGMFKQNTEFVLLDDDSNELYVGAGYKCQAWLMKNDKYDIFPEDGGTWVEVDNNQVVIFLTEILE